MTREILFRGKRIDNEKWVEGYYWVPSKEDGVHCIRKPSSVIDGKFYEHQVYPKTVGQMLFKVGDAKVFEGDYCKFDLRYVDESMPSIKGLKGVVVFNNGIITIGDYHLHYCINIVLIDNIQNNPELLNNNQ